ncbi:hypothetical protein [Dactylosporangium sp. CS-033363]|uniref:hypothetical protein n=1 Tax=Dactylosporangium sp. CS-033363 TaxID=3239935 RepID=UPI003D92E99A
MRVFRLTVAALLASVVAVLALAPAANAADSNARLKSRSDGRCAAVSYLNQALIRPDCSYTQTKWLYQPRSKTPNNHDLVKFQSNYNKGCIDTNGGGNGALVVSIACNTGANQLWEVFPVGSYYVYKSWGAWTLRGEHLCLWAKSNYEEHLTTCDTTAYNQQWTKSAW